MKRSTQTLIFATTATCLAFGAAHAYAAEPAPTAQAVTSKVTVFEKTAVSEKPPVIRVDEPLPDLIVPLDTSIGYDAVDADPIPVETRTYESFDVRDFDLVEDSPVFVGARGPSEFDRIDARWDDGAYPRSLNVDPLFTVAGAGVTTSF